MLFNGEKLTGNEPMDRRFMFIKKGLSAKFISLYLRSQVSVYMTIGPLVFVYIEFLMWLTRPLYSDITCLFHLSISLYTAVRTRGHSR